jgi:hypothetical protein
MPIVAGTGSDTLKINDRIFSGFADGDVVHLTFPNDITTVKTGKNGNSMVAFKYDGRQVDVSLRLLRGCSDDKFLNNLYNLFENNPSGFSMIQGEFVKNISDGAGNILQETYTLMNGVFKKKPEAMDNADGNTDQAVTVWQMTFTVSRRSIG